MDPSTLFFLDVPETSGRYLVSTALAHELRRGPFLPSGSVGSAGGRLHYGGHNVVRRHPESPVRRYTHCVQWAPGWEDSLRFTVVRNPFDLLVAMYTGADPLIPRHADFDSFVRTFCDPEAAWPVPAQKENLYFQLFEEDGSCPLDAILHHEHLDDELAMLCAPLGIQPVRARLSSRLVAPDHRRWYSDRLREEVEKACAFELAWTGYDFDGLRAEVLAA